MKFKAQLGFMVKILATLSMAGAEFLIPQEHHRDGVLFGGNVAAGMSHITLPGSTSPKSYS